MGGQIDPLAGKSPHWVGFIGEWWSRDRYLITGLIVAIAFRGGKWRYGKFTQASRNFGYWIQKPISNLNKMIWKIGYWIIKFKNQYPITKFLYYSECAAEDTDTPNAHWRLWCPGNSWSRDQTFQEQQFRSFPVSQETTSAYPVRDTLFWDSTLIDFQ